MTLLILGLALFVVLHLIPMFPAARQGIAGALGEGPYKGVFSLLSLLGIVLIVMGWGDAPADFIYVPPAGLRHATMLLVLLAFILFSASHGKTNIKRFIRHPMLTGMLLWAIGHLLANGEQRAVILFATFAVWALIEMLLSNARDGAREKPAAVPVTKDITVVIIGVMVYAAVAYAHPWLFGVAVIP